jgi:hypothetical protein
MPRERNARWNEDIIWSEASVELNPMFESVIGTIMIIHYYHIERGFCQLKNISDDFI